MGCESSSTVNCPEGTAIKGFGRVDDEDPIMHS